MVNDLIFEAPESSGLPSRAVLDFLDFISEMRINLHSFMLVRDGKILTEAYYKPFDKNSERRLYSCSKSIAALAVGALVGDGLVSLSAPLASYFPQFSPKDEQFLKTTVEDALKMTLPFVGSHYSRSPGEPGQGKLISDGWDSAYFSDKHPSVKLPGTLFSYHSHTSYILGLLPERLTGKTFLEYLRPIFDEIGVSKDIRCVNSPDGHPWASSGVIMTMRDFAKIGELILNKGRVGDKQLLPRDYMERATSPLTTVQCDGGYSPAKCGYGYQIWVEEHGYGMHGMGGQFVFCFPKKNFMFVCNADTQDSKGNRMDEIYREAAKLYKAIGDEPISAGADYEQLCSRLEHLTVDRAFGAAHSDIEREVGGRTYKLSKNPMGITDITFDFSGDGGSMTYTTPRGEKRIDFGMGKYLEITFPEQHYYISTIKRPGGRGQRALATASFPVKNKLLLNVDIIDDSLANLGIAVEFVGDELSLVMTNSAEEFLENYRGYAIGKMV